MAPSPARTGATRTTRLPSLGAGTWGVLATIAVVACISGHFLYLAHESASVAEHDALVHEAWAITGIVGFALVALTLALLPTRFVPGSLVAIACVAAIVAEVVVSVGTSRHDVALMTLGVVVFTLGTGVIAVVTRGGARESAALRP